MLLLSTNEFKYRTRIRNSKGYDTANNGGTKINFQSQYLEKVDLLLNPKIDFSAH